MMTLLKTSDSKRFAGNMRRTAIAHPHPDHCFCRHQGSPGPGGQAPQRPDSPAQMRQESMTVIAKTPGVCGGAACVSNSLVPVWVIVLMSERGAGLEEILTAYPQLTPADCATALNYALIHRAEIDADITWNKNNV